MAYIFRPPAAAVHFSWKLEDVLAWLAKGGEERGILGGRERKLGTTVTVCSFVHRGVGPHEVHARVTLYDTDIARIWEDRVQVGGVDSHQSQATRWWIERILASNTNLGHVFSESRQYRAMSYSPDGDYVALPIDNQEFRRTEP